MTPHPHPSTFAGLSSPSPFVNFFVNVWFSTASLAGEKNQDSSVDRCLQSWGEKKNIKYLSDVECELYADTK